MAEPPRTHRDEVDGIPVVWGEDTVPFSAGLEFRVARCDETLPTGGITHLVEHLALPIRRQPRVQFNGQVEGLVTSFYASGPRERVLALLRETAARLGALPLDRLEIERQTLLTEAEGAGRGPLRMASMLRFGPTGHGLGGYDEYGLFRLTADEVGEWAATRFVRGNAAVWMTGRPPDELGFELAPGPRRPPPEPQPVPYLRYPTTFEYGPPGVVSLSFLAERSYDTMAALRILEGRLLERLRYSSGLSYGVQWWHEPLTADIAHVVVWADTRDENTARVRDGLIETIDEFAESGPTEEEVADDLEEMRAASTEPGFVASVVARGPRDELAGGAFEDLRTELDRQAAVTPESAAAALRRGLETMLVVVPDGVGPGSLEPYPMEPPARIEGARRRLRGVGARMRRLDRSPHLVVGDEGIARVLPETTLGIRFDECEALLRWPAGSRALWSRDGFYLELDPDAWQGGREVVALVDARVPADRVVPMVPELEARVTAVEDALEGKVKRGFMTSSELDALPTVLDEDERVVVVSRADLGWKAGVLAVTDRRLLFLYFADVVLELPRAAVRVVRPRRSAWRGNRIVVETAHAAHTFTSVPGDRLDELADALRPGAPAS